VDDPDSHRKLLQIMETLVSEADFGSRGIARTVVGNLKVMARMGTILEDLVRREYPEVPIQVGFAAGKTTCRHERTLVQLERTTVPMPAMAATRDFRCRFP